MQEAIGNIAGKSKIIPNKDELC